MIPVPFELVQKNRKRRKASKLFFNHINRSKKKKIMNISVYAEKGFETFQTIFWFQNTIMS